MDANVSPYLRQSFKPRPTWLPGDRIRAPGRFGFDVVLSVKWIDGDWRYVWDSDAVQQEGNQP